MQPAASGVEGVKLIKGEVGYMGQELMNEKSFLKKQRENVPIDQIFFYDYFSRKHEKEKALALAKAKAKAKAKKKKKGKDEDEDDSESDDRDADGEVVERSGDAWDEDVASDAEEADVWKVFPSSVLSRLQ